MGAPSRVGDKIARGPVRVVKSVQNVPLLVVQPGVVEEMRERLQPEELPETV